MEGLPPGGAQAAVLLYKGLLIRRAVERPAGERVLIEVVRLDLQHAEQAQQHILPHGVQAVFVVADSGQAHAQRLGQLPLAEAQLLSPLTQPLSKAHVPASFVRYI